MNPYSVYIHIPFCRHRCCYCDFNTYAGQEILIPSYLKALCAEIEWGALSCDRMPVHTLFFGGGTPSLLKITELEEVIHFLVNSYEFSPDIEISLEANPGTLSLAYLDGLYHLGFNRISLGLQSANPLELQFLERQHDYEAVIQSVYWARQVGFDNINLDLIFGLPDQTMIRWQHSLELALKLLPEHLSIYALTIEHGTPLELWTRRGLVNTPDPDLAADQYEWASERLTQAGFYQYEISNWAQEREGELMSCRHNLQYWRGLPYLGFGAGAHGYATGYRTANVLMPGEYIRRCLDPHRADTARSSFPWTPATQTLAALDLQDEIGEYMMMGLRLTIEGVSAQEFRNRFGVSLREKFGPQIKRLIEQGLLEWDGPTGETLRLTKPGRLLGNRVFAEFI